MIYRIEVDSEADNHQGYVYKGTRREADRYAAAARREGFAARVDAVPVPASKAEILALLNRWASHNNNG